MAAVQDPDIVGSNRRRQVSSYKSSVISSFGQDSIDYVNFLLEHCIISDEEGAVIKRFIWYLSHNIFRKLKQEQDEKEIKEKTKHEMIYVKAIADYLRQLEYEKYIDISQRLYTKWITGGCDYSRERLTNVDYIDVTVGFQQNKESSSQFNTYLISKLVNCIEPEIRKIQLKEAFNEIKSYSNKKKNEETHKKNRQPDFQKESEVTIKYIGKELQSITPRAGRESPVHHSRVKPISIMLKSETK